MKKIILVFLIGFLAANALCAMPLAFTDYGHLWYYMGLGVSLSVPDFKLSLNCHWRLNSI
jgi:hypothetical protein